MIHTTKELLEDPEIKKAVMSEIGHIIYNDTLELIPGKGECRIALLKKGFKQRQGFKTLDMDKYILNRKYRIHVKATGKKNTCYYHLDKH